MINIVNDLEYLSEIISMSIKNYFSNEHCQIFKFINEERKFSIGSVKELSDIPEEEKLVLLLTLSPHIKPNFFDTIIQKHMPQGGDFPEFGGVKGTNQRGMLPTGETVQFILAGDNVDKRLEVQKYFSREHKFHKLGILSLEKLKEGEPAMSGRIVMSPEWIEYLLTGVMPGISFSQDFPANLLKTKMEWDDLIINPQTKDLLNDIKDWLAQREKIYSDEVLSPKISQGYRALFFGPPGTGKTLTASLLGKEFNKPVYRIDLSMVVSKYIGETEKNLGKVFDKAMNKDWILFFDEADALFAKRTGVQSSHDKYANQEVSYLLQRVEEFTGLLILASNFKSNIDEAFVRRFNSIILFPKPDARERLQIWQNCIPSRLRLSGDVLLESISGKYDLTGAMIVNIIHYAAIKTFALSKNEISNQIIMEGIRKELQKEEKSMY
ncbi:MAG TPA: ATP-binding protein [Ignavibacteria bacterium]|nr:ATP-binding protein [Ignavibacteria bacterium]HMR39464.1 ATP-binding protein [Ignavibacteria bacterium]